MSAKALTRFMIIMAFSTLTCPSFVFAHHMEKMRSHMMHGNHMGQRPMGQQGKMKAVSSVKSEQSMAGHKMMKRDNSKMMKSAIMPPPSSDMMHMEMNDNYNMANSWIIRGGSATVSPTNDSDVANIINQKIEAKKDTQFGLSFTYMLSDNVAMELLASTPFKHDINQKDKMAIGTVKLLPPTLSAEYYFAPASNRWQPYVGIGVNYTTFFSEKLDKRVKDLDFRRMELEDSIGLAGQIGIDFYINKNWLVNASAMYADIKTKATIYPNDSKESIKVTTNLNPWIYRINLGYHF